MSEEQPPAGDDSRETSPDPTGSKRDDALRLAREIADAYRSGAPAPTQKPRGRRPPRAPRRAQREDASPISDLLGQVVSHEGWEERLSARRVFTDWAGIVGPEIAQHSEVVSYEDGQIEVRTDSTAWATQLRLLAPRLVAKLNTELGDGSVLKILVRGPQAPSWKKGRRSIRGARGPRDTYG